MEKQKTRLRINLSTREVEVEGSEEFVREYAVRFEDALSLLIRVPEAGKLPKEKEPSASKEYRKTSVPPVLEVFGEYLNSFPRDVADIDKVLIAAYHVQTEAQEDCFTTKQANDLLKSQGIKVANASGAVKLHTENKRAFSISKRKYRVSQDGINYINSLVSR